MVCSVWSSSSRAGRAARSRSSRLRLGWPVRRSMAVAVGPRWPPESLEALAVQPAMVHPGFDAGGGQPFVLELGEAFAPGVDLAAFLVVQFAGLFAKAVRAQPAGGEQDVGVVVAQVAFPARAVNGYVSGAAVALDQFAGKVVGQPLPFAGVEFAGQGQFKFAGDR